MIVTTGLVGCLLCLLIGGAFGLPLWVSLATGTTCLIVGIWGQNLADAVITDREEEDAERADTHPR